MSAPSITAIVLTYNEKLHIARCIERLCFVDQVIVIDSHSTDGTQSIARTLGADVYERAFINQAEQFQWAMDTVTIRGDWTLRVDADEYLESALIDDLNRRLPALPSSIAGVVVRRKMIFRRRWIRWGTYYPIYLLRLWRTGKARIEQRWMDEHVQLIEGERVTLTGGDLVDENLQSIGTWTDKHNHYATRHMIDFLGRELGFIAQECAPRGQAARLKRWLRERVFSRSPLYLRSVGYYVYRYFFRLGFLDGKQGFVWHFLHGFWYFMLMDAKIDEARDYVRVHGRDAFPRYLRERYGIDIETHRP